MLLPPLESLRRLVAEERRRLRDAAPAGESAISALVRAIDQAPVTTGPQEPDLLTGNRIVNLGGNLALASCLDDSGDEEIWTGEGATEGWASDFLARCGRLAQAEIVLGHSESGFMRLAEEEPGVFHAWIASKRQPAAWRERLDWDRWAVRSRKRDGRDSGEISASERVSAMAYQFGYLADAEIAGTSVAVYTGVLERLIAWALQERERGEVPQPQPELALAERLSATIGGDPIELLDVLAVFTVDRANAAYHAAVPGIAAAPLVRVGPDQLVWSLYGLLTEPLLFLSRELKRRNPEAYHNAAIQREAVFRHDIYALFTDKRFVLAPRRIELRRDKGDLRTDIDALVFDRKTGTLGLFELKSQDPFVRSHAELVRQRDNVLYANRQIAGVLAWIKQHGADGLVARVDARTARTFKAHRVCPFVLGRYLVHFNDGAEPDTRAAWGTWPQLLQLFEQQPIQATDSNPIASLFSRLSKDKETPPTRLSSTERYHAVSTASFRLAVYASFAAYQAAHPAG